MAAARPPSCGSCCGFWSRLAIARAFLKDAPLLILDEPTSALDPESERVVRAGVERLAEGRTLLIVAHRLNTVATADPIVVLRAGAVVERGTQAELLHQDGLYARRVGAHRSQRRLAKIAGLRVGLQDAVVRLGAWGVLLVSISLVAAHGLAPIYAAVPAILLLGAAEVIEPLALAVQRLGATRAAAARMWAIADRPPALAFPADAGEPPAARTLEFRDVSSTYSHAPVLTDVSFGLRRGEALGIVGPSGAGKSTLLQLAARAWDPTSGQVLLDGRDLRTFAAEAVTRSVGLLSQNSTIFSATLRHNLQLARPSATDRDLERALQVVGLGDLLAELPSGLDTWLGDQGSRLSGGEGQRLALARMLLMDTPFLLLDEPTANLDPVSEGAIMRTLRAASRTRGMLLVSHRVLELDWLDELLVLDGGHIVERGRPAALRAAGGLYARLVAVEESLLARTPVATAPRSGAPS